MASSRSLRAQSASPQRVGVGQEAVQQLGRLASARGRCSRWEPCVRLEPVEDRLVGAVCARVRYLTRAMAISSLGQKVLAATASGVGTLERHAGCGIFAGSMLLDALEGRGLEVPLLSGRQAPAHVGAQRCRVPAHRLDLGVDGLVVAVAELHAVAVGVAAGTRKSMPPGPWRPGPRSTASAVAEVARPVAGGEDVTCARRRCRRSGASSGRRSPRSRGPGRCPCGT